MMVACDAGAARLLNAQGWSAAPELAELMEGRFTSSNTTTAPGHPRPLMQQLSQLH